MKGRNMRTLILIAALGLISVLSAPLRADEIRLQDNPPDRHVVVKGDTLWDISEKFLKDPWKWPEVWQLNKEQIRNPHLIYPGDVVVLTMEGGKPRLSLEDGRFGETVKLSPQVRGEPIITKEKGIPAIDPKYITPYVTVAGVVDPGMLDAAPKVLGAVDERVLIMKGDSVYASAGKPDTLQWKVIRPGKQLIDPDTNELLGLEAESVGRLRTIVPGNPQTLLVEQASMEIMVGDKLIPDAPFALSAMTPHAPANSVEGKIIQAYGSFSTTAQYATVVINKGLRDGIEPGHVLAIQRQGRLLQENNQVQLPGHKVGLLFIYRVYDKVAYGLIMSADGPVYLMDVVKNP
jgi:hypothetical protein